MSARVRILCASVTFGARERRAFADLNYEWIRHYFEVEAEDTRVLEDPEGEILGIGGEIFLAELDGDLLGVAAMIPNSHGFELAKMAVSPALRGSGLGRALMDACLAFAKARGAKEVELLTNTILSPARGLYESSGFVALPQMEDTRYSRGNLQMVLKLDD